MVDIEKQDLISEAAWRSRIHHEFVESGDEGSDEALRNYARKNELSYHLTEDEQEKTLRIADLLIKELQQEESKNRKKK